MNNVVPTFEYGIISMEMYIPKIYIDQSDFEISKKISPGAMNRRNLFPTTRRAGRPAPRL